MSGSFLDAGSFPTAKFSSRQLKATTDGEYEMVGELTLHGVTRGLRMPVEIEVTDCAIDVVVAFSFDRHAFEIQNDGSLESLVADTVAIRFELKLKRPCQPPT
jgi:polyisoprenoid-binding protein YceI